MYFRETRLRVSSTNVNVFVMRLCVCNRIQVQLNGFNGCQLFSLVCRLTVNCEESDSSLVVIHVLCSSLCAAHVLQQHELGIKV